MRYLTLALAKGRLARNTMELFEKIGISCEEMKDKSTRKLIFVNEENKIDTVIGLPQNLFYSTGIPVCILVLKKCRRDDGVLFINAAENYEKGKRQNVLLDEHINKIVETYQNRTEENRYSRMVSMDEIEKNGFNLNISRYVSTAEEEEIIDLKAVKTELDTLEQQLTAAKEKHNAFLRELGLDGLR